MIVTIDYTNWKGVRRLRRIIPSGVLRYGTTEWHKEPQWLMPAIDVDDGRVQKEFAMKDIHEWRQE